MIKGAIADTEKIQLVVQNISGEKVDGLMVYAGQVYDDDDSPPLFQINIGDAIIGNTTNTAGLSNDYVINFIDGYKTPMAAGSVKTVIIPWPISGFAGGEFGAGGCDFFAESLGKGFDAEITVYYRDQLGLVKEETATCTGTIEEAEIIDFPPEAWDCP